MILKTTGLNPHDDHIAHHGVLGMKWGRRKHRERERNRDYRVRTKSDVANIVGIGAKHIYKSGMAKAKKLYNDIHSGNKYKAYPAVIKYNQQMIRELGNAKWAAHDRWAKAYEYKRDAYVNGDMAKYQMFGKMEKKYRKQEYELDQVYRQQSQKLKDNPYAFPDNDILYAVLAQQHQQATLENHRRMHDQAHMTALQIQGLI